MQWIPSEDGSFGVVSRNLIREIAKKQLQLPWVGAVSARLDGPDLPGGWQFLLFYVWELTALHQNRIGRLQNVHRIVGISRHVARILESYGIEARGGQLGVDTDVFRPLKERRPGQHFVFGSVIAANSRSGLDILLEGFRLAFGNRRDVLLKIKLYSPPEPRLVKYIESFGVNVEVMDCFWNWSEEQMCEFYNSLDCFVYPTRTTAWGMPLSEACACGVPCIVTDYSAPPEFIDSEIGWLLPAKEVEVDWDYCRKMAQEHGWIHHWPEEGYLKEVPKWAEPDKETLAQLLQDAVDSPELIQQKGQFARQKMVNNFTWAHSLEKILQALEIESHLSISGG